MFLGSFIQTSSGLAIMSMSIFSPLADKSDCPRAVVVNSYLLGQTLISLITPTGIILMITQITHVPYKYWLKFIWLYLISILAVSLLFIIIDTYA